MEGFVAVFSTIVALQSFHLFSCNCFDFVNLELECLECVGSVLREIYYCYSRIVVDECAVVFKTSKRGC